MTIAVAGGYGVGMTMRVAAAPEAGETVTGGALSVGHGGKGSNQAVAAARLGAKVSLFTAIGDDAPGESARALWSEEGIDASPVVVVECATMTGFILVDAHGENRISLSPGALSELTAEHAETFRSALRSADLALVSLEIPLDTAQAILRIAHEEGTRTILNPAPALAIGDDVWPLIDILTPNLSEANLLLGAPTDATPDLASTARALQRRCGGTVVLTAGAQGVFVDDGVDQFSIPAVRGVDVVDTTGAGDAFTAALGVALVEGKELRDAVVFAAQAGAHAVTIADVIPSLATREQLDDFISRTSASQGQGIQ